MTFEEIKDSITEKLGEETSAMISDDLANLLSYDSEQKQTIEKITNDNKKLIKDKEMLISANGRLLQQVADTNDTSAFEHNSPVDSQEAKKEPLDYRTLFDKNGKFIN